MAFIDDVNTVRNRAEQARKDMNTLVKQLEDGLYAAARPLPALGWVTDEVLHQSCAAFALTAVQQTVSPRPVLGTPGQILT